MQKKSHLFLAPPTLYYCCGKLFHTYDRKPKHAHVAQIMLDTHDNTCLRRYHIAKLQIYRRIHSTNYRHRYKNEQLIQLTEDDTVLQKLLNEGKISQQQFEELPMHNMISKALGLTNQLEISNYQFSIEDEDKYVLCSDGLTNCLTDEQIGDVLSSSTDLNDCVDELITRSNDNGGFDNISVVIVDSVSSL